MTHRPSTVLVRAAKETARQLRRSQTPSEAALWEKLRNRQLSGLKFLRQHPLFVAHANREGFFIADFFCSEHRLVVEVDGAVHDGSRNYDDNRTEVLKALGLRVLRFRNEEVEQNLDDVLKQIRDAANSPPNPLSWKERGNRKIK